MLTLSLRKYRYIKWIFFKQITPIRHRSIKSIMQTFWDCLPWIPYKVRGAFLKQVPQMFFSGKSQHISNNSVKMARHNKLIQILILEIACRDDSWWYLNKFDHKVRKCKMFPRNRLLMTPAVSPLRHTSICELSMTLLLMYSFQCQWSLNRRTCFFHVFQPNIWWLTRQ